MSIIIKGMEMPQNCESCPMCHRRFDGYRQETRLACYAVEDWAEEEEGRLDNCPLIELPPHGRLKDESDIISLIETMFCEDKDGMECAIQCVKDVDTVIEAEGSEE